jgi:hypothetical protein
LRRRTWRTCSIYRACTRCSAPARAPREAGPLRSTARSTGSSRLADEAEARGDVRAFARADRELATLAASPELAEAVAEAANASMASPEPTTSAAEADASGGAEDVRSLNVLLAEFLFDDPAAVAKAMVTLPVAAGLRAALDWIAADAGGRLHVEVQDAAPHAGGARRARGRAGGRGRGAGIDRRCAPARARWPLVAARAAARGQAGVLLARQGELSLALPWHAVARLRITDEARAPP